MSTRLSVNVNKIAVLRNSRGGRDPDVLAAASACLEAGAHGITVHPRPDRRHIVAEDLPPLARLAARFGVELNIEGNPFAPARPGYPGLLALCEQTRPAQVTLVPDGDGQLTSDHGFSFESDTTALAVQVAAFTSLGCRVSLFVDAGNADMALRLCVDTARRAQAVGLGVNAGHDLSQANLGLFLDGVPGVLEVSIGHALVGEALYAGLEPTVRAYLDIVGR
jgi:pyridoxine 5-phosphate synthase